MQNKKYSISDCVLECNGLSMTETIARLKLIKDSLKQDWDNCPAEELPAVDILLEFIELAIYHINTGDMNFPDDYPLHDELVRLCRSVKINADKETDPQPL